MAGQSGHNEAVLDRFRMESALRAAVWDVACKISESRGPLDMDEIHGWAEELFELCRHAKREIRSMAQVRELRALGATRIRVGDIEADFPPEIPEPPAPQRSRPPTPEEYRREQERVLGVDLGVREEVE